MNLKLSWTENIRCPLFAALIFYFVILRVTVVQGLEISNGDLKLTLETSKQGVPYISLVRWVDSNKTIFVDTGDGQVLQEWVPKKLIVRQTKSSEWTRHDDQNFLRAQASCELGDGLTITWMVELIKKGSIIRTQIRMANHGDKSREVMWFPIWIAFWSVPSGVEGLRWWRAFTFEEYEKSTFEEYEKSIVAGGEVSLGSRLHSSDLRPQGQNPYWLLKGSEDWVYFALEWCGGWRAKLKGTNKDFSCHAYLPPEETQLTLNAGEEIGGPVLNITPVRGVDEISRRAEWMGQRVALAKRIYGGPEPWFPFTHNSWYSIGFELNTDFIRRQAELLDQYDFDVFIIDAGWYDNNGSLWEPDSKKFSAGEFEKTLKEVKNKGITVGIWSCPQYVHHSIEEMKAHIDQSRFRVRGEEGYLLDYDGFDFASFLLDHVSKLRNRYSVGWWKYDRYFFTERSRAGVMKNVVAFQKALLTVRKSYPDMYFENCLSGGRMINEFTALVAQIQWICDGGGTGLPRARLNMKQALGALGFLLPWTINRWTTNLDLNDQLDDELTRMYCRSAMAGQWGVSANLTKIGAHQRKVIREEVNHYRRLNRLKGTCLYELHPVREDASAVGVTFYDTTGTRAGILLLRWNQDEAFDYPVMLGRLSEEGEYQIEMIDSQKLLRRNGKRLRENGIKVRFGTKQLSEIVFIDAVQKK